MNSIFDDINEVANKIACLGLKVLKKIYSGEMYFEVESISVSYFEAEYNDPLIDVKVRWGRYEKAANDFDKNGEFTLNDLEYINEDVIYGIVHQFLENEGE